MIKKIYSNRYAGALPKGCKLCMKGAKVVLFVSGICSRKCFYCPISLKKKNVDQSWVNERLVRKTSDVIHEAKRMSALGAGITGGDPDLSLEKTLKYIRLLKKEFGKKFHIHMYTSNALSRGTLEKLKNAGLDEIRFHITDNGEIWNSIKNSAEIGINTGVEIPVIPEQHDRIVEVVRKLSRIKGSFLNLNELEFSETNLGEFKKRGYELKSETSYVVKGSEATAFKILASCQNFKRNIHYCSSAYKDSVQLRKRLLRTAKNTAKDYEEVSGDGLLLKGVIAVEKPDLKKLSSLRKNLIEEFKIPENLIAVDKEKLRIETTTQIAEELSKLRKGLRYSLVEEYPTSDRLETEVVPLEDE
ncbi:MAG: radical SAM protein [Candidatus Hydrothermarchaeota archaeon]|nr:radical SAM protein [Candidatus Hydrothermarchaeota archaeon]